ncbi:unnamed protein product, partial [Rhizoctonia solani]
MIKQELDEIELDLLPIEPQAGSATSNDKVSAPAVAQSKKEEVKHIFLDLSGEPYDTYLNSRDIIYTPHKALEQVDRMVKRAEKAMNQLHIGTGLQKDMWQKTIDGLKVYRPQDITIAICGGTGAGKSSLINAVVEAKILPISDMRACTSAVVDLRYHPHAYYRARITFVTRTELELEFGESLEDIKSKSCPDGGIDFEPEFRQAIKQSGEKILALCPTLTHEALVDMTVDGLISLIEPTSLLGTTISIQEDMAPAFCNLLAPYMTADIGASRTFQPWPLVKSILVYVNSKALQPGLRLLDLPGAGDSSEARNKLAKSYLKDADHIWVVTSIKRAADEGIANGKTNKRAIESSAGIYDPQHIAIVATNTDHVDGDDIIKSLGLENDHELQDIHARLATLEHALENTLLDYSEENRLTSNIEKLNKRKKRLLAMRRNDYIKNVLQQQFYNELREIDPGYASSQNASTPHPGALKTRLNELQVFTCSSHDYLWLKGRMTGIIVRWSYKAAYFGLISGTRTDKLKANCFLQPEETEIPRLQNHCIELALAAQRDPVLRKFQGLERVLRQFRTFAGTSVDGSRRFEDKLSLANKWESKIPIMGDEELPVLLSLISVAFERGCGRAGLISPRKCNTNE